MLFNFFGFKKTPIVDEAVVKDKNIPTATPKTFDEALAEQAFANAAKKAAKEAEVIEQEEGVKSEPNEPVKAALPAGQLDQLEATREDVIAAFKIFLGRMPESETVLDTWIGVKPQALLGDFLKSAEFLGNAQKSQFILALAKKILDERKQAAAAEGAAPSAEAAAR